MNDIELAVHLADGAGRLLLDLRDTGCSHPRRRYRSQGSRSEEED